MINNPYFNRPPRPGGRPGNDRFIFPFLLGGLAGGAAVGLTRPRPIYNVAPYPPFNPYRPAGGYSYSYYVPYGNNFPY